MFVTVTYPGLWQCMNGHNTFIHVPRQRISQNLLSGYLNHFDPQSNPSEASESDKIFISLAGLYLKHIEAEENFLNRIQKNWSTF